MCFWQLNHKASASTLASFFCFCPQNLIWRSLSPSDYTNWINRAKATLKLPCEWLPVPLQPWKFQILCSEQALVSFLEMLSGSSDLSSKCHRTKEPLSACQSGVNVTQVGRRQDSAFFIRETRFKSTDTRLQWKPKIMRLLLSDMEPSESN